MLLNFAANHLHKQTKQQKEKDNDNVIATKCMAID